MFSCDLGGNGNTIKDRALSHDNVFSSPKGLPYFSADMVFNQLEEDEDECS